jgi:hypothetical protein
MQLEELQKIVKKSVRNYEEFRRELMKKNYICDSRANCLGLKL